MATQIKLRRDTAANWASSNPVLAQGEPGYDLTHNRLKIGNGTTPWNSLDWTTGTADISDFGEGFSLTATNKIVTNKLYSTNQTNNSQHYRLTLDTNGVVVLPDQSIINGATLRVVPGTGDLNYAALAAGPDISHPEQTWIWADSTGAWVQTNSYVSDSIKWHFDNDGHMVFPAGSEHYDLGAGNSILSHNTKVNGNVWAFGSDGNLTLPENGLIKNSDGSTYGGGNANTGSITFADINIYGATSMDFPLGGITLVPNQNSSFTNQGQYLNIYPTINQDAPHIHIAAGIGGESNGDLILGDDQHNVDVNHQGYISIQSNDAIRGWTNGWTFDTDGTLNPNNGTLYINNTIEAKYGQTLYLNGSFISRGTQTIQFSNADGTEKTEYTVDGNTFYLVGINDPNVGGVVLYDNGTQYYPNNISHDSGTNVWTFTFGNPVTFQAPGATYVVDWFYLNPQSVQINGGEQSWSFRPDGNVVQNNVGTRATYDTPVPSGSSAVVFSCPNYNAGMKLVIKTEGRLDGDGTNTDHTQMAEAIVAWSYNNSLEPVMSVYGIVHTSPSPLVTFNVQRNTVNNTIEVVALNSQSSNTMQVAVHAVQFASTFD